MIPSLPLSSSDQTQRIELEYDWEFITDPSARLQFSDIPKQTGWRNARVGLSWNVQFEDLRDYMGAAWYRKRFALPEFIDARHVLLKFGAVDYFCEVFLNGLSIGTHEGGYTPFSFEVTNAIRPGVNELVVRVIDPPMDEAENRALFPEMMYNEIPHGKQNWYVQNSGIWQGIRIEVCPSLYIERLDVTSNINGEFQIEARLAGIALTAEQGAIAAKTQFHAQIYDQSGRNVFEHTQAVTEYPAFHIKGVIPNPKQWSNDSPSLYVLETFLSGAVQYRRRVRFGFRRFEARNGKLFLNGKPFYMVAGLDQDFYPETVHTPTSEGYVRDMMTKAKRLGINVLRCHLKVAHPVYLDVADELGMLVWTELPSWSDCWFPSDHFSAMAAVRTEKMFWEILIRDCNHPCIVIQTIMNESWGINLKDAGQRRWLRDGFDRIKSQLTPLGRVVIDNSPCEGNFHIKTDIEDFHQYYSMPDQKEEWDKWLTEFAARPAWTFSPYGDSQRTGEEPLVVSEFGNWGLPKLPDEVPWWFDGSFGGREVTRPSGVIQRFAEYKFGESFENFDELAVETQWHQFVSLKYEIESIRWHSSIQGYVITGITDVHWEVNGLLDMWRNEKIFASELAKLQQSDLIICKLPKHSFFAGEQIDLPIALSHYSENDLAGARVRWSTDSGTVGQIFISENVSPGNTTYLQPISLHIPLVEKATADSLEIEVRLKNGHRICENTYDLFVLPSGKPSNPITAGLRLSSEPYRKIQELFRRAGYLPTSDASNSQPGRLIIADRYDLHLDAHLRHGGRVLLLINSVEAISEEWPIKVKARAGSDLDGRWFSNYNWVRLDREPFSSVNVGRILGFESAEVAPDFVIQNVAGNDFDDVLSGITYGWLNKNAALALQVKIGAGNLLLTTFDFTSYGIDAYATALFDSMARYCASAMFNPSLQMPALGAETETKTRRSL